jgi:hypothetical protein
METKQAILAVAATLLAFAAPASAQEAGATGSYNVKFQEISNSCTEVGLALSKGTLAISRAGKQALEVKLPQVPVLRGKARKGGKFKVAASKSPTALSGVDGSFSAAGRRDESSVQLVLVAEYYRDGKPLCTQSWDVSGARRRAPLR